MTMTYHKAFDVHCSLFTVAKCQRLATLSQTHRRSFTLKHRNIRKLQQNVLKKRGHTRSLRLSIPGLTSRYNCNRPLAPAVTALSLLFLYSIKSPNRSSSIAHGCLLQTSLIEFKPAATTSLPTPGCINSLANFRTTGVNTSGGVKSCTDWASETRMAGTRSWW